MKKKVLAILFTWFLPAIVLAANTFYWNPPTTNIDGTPLTDLKGFKMYCGVTSLNYTIIKDIGNAGVDNKGFIAGGEASSLISNVLTAEGQYYCAMTAYDTTNNESTKSNEKGPFPFGVAPAVSVSAPSNGATVSGVVQVIATATDNIGVTKVEFYRDNVLTNTDTISPYAWTWDTTLVADGPYSLSIKAYDAIGYVGNSAVITVTVANATVPPAAPSGFGVR